MYACMYVLTVHDMIWYDMIWYDMIWYDMIWYDMIWYDMIWYVLSHMLRTTMFGTRNTVFGYNVHIRCANNIINTWFVLQVYNLTEGPTPHGFHTDELLQASLVSIS